MHCKQFTICQKAKKETDLFLTKVVKNRRPGSKPYKPQHKGLTYFGAFLIMFTMNNFVNGELERNILQKSFTYKSRNRNSHRP